MGLSPVYIVHDELRFVYFVTPKVACSSVKMALAPLFDFGSSDYGAVTPPPVRPSVPIHRVFGSSPYQIRREEFMQALTEDGYRDYLKFAFVRNPWDRLLSCYVQKLGENSPKLGEHDPGPGFLRGYPQAQLYKGMPFVEFVEAVCRIPDEDANPHFRSQYRTVCEAHENGLVVLADFVGRFENLGQDFARVAEMIGAPHLKLPHTLSSKNGGSYRDYYNDRLKKLVYRRFSQDVEIFDYSF